MTTEVKKTIAREGRIFAGFLIFGILIETIGFLFPIGSNSPGERIKFIGSFYIFYLVVKLIIGAIKTLLKK